MAITIALAGNPNSGKTTLFNDLTGANQYVGNWPGVTVEKKDGKLHGAKDVIIQDLPGIYSLSPYTLEEVVARGYLVNERPDAILNIVDASNIERNLYLSTQLAELGIPMVMALNMIDLVRKNGDKIDLKKLGATLGITVMETSALKGEGSIEAAKTAAEAARAGKAAEPLHVFQGSVEHAIAHIEDSIQHAIADKRLMRWYAVKLFERDEKVLAELKLDDATKTAIEKAITDCENELNDDAESIITNQRYAYISRVMDTCVKKGKKKGSLSTSDKIDKIVTNRWLALPIFALIMWLVYYVSVTTIGTIVTDWTNDTFVAEWIQEPARVWLQGMAVAPWLVGLICDGIIAGVGAVLGFVPQMLVLFFFLAILEDVGYMARVAFILDRVFRKFGLSGKSFIPMLVSSGCGVPGVMASRTIESDRDRKLTIMTTTFVPCGAKIPIIAMLAGALFHNNSIVATSAYFIGVAAIIISGIMLKKTKMFAGDPAPFVMELPTYHVPSPKNVLHSMWERGFSFIKRAGSVILVSAIVIWFLSGYGWTAAQPAETAEVAADATAITETAETPADAPMVFGEVENMDESILGKAGSAVAPVFNPVGFGKWQPTVATVMGLVAKEEVVGVFGVLFGVDGAIKNEDGEDMTAQDIAESEDLDADAKAEALSPILTAFDEASGGHAKLGAYAFMIFNLLCAPCFAAIGAIKREMNNTKWTLFAVAYQCIFAYIIALITFQIGVLAVGGSFTAWTGIAFVLCAGLLYMLFRKNRNDDNHLTQKV